MSLTNFTKTLTWNDFTKVPAKPPRKFEDASISVTWDIDASFGRQGNAIVIASYTVNVFLVSEGCWVVTAVAAGPQSAELLKHEQGHFDIMAIGGREFHNRVGKLSAATEDELNKKITELRLEIESKTDLVDERYDTATNHSINKAVQQTWDQKLDAVKKNPKGTVADLPSAS